MSKTYEYICDYCKKSFQSIKKYPLTAKNYYCSRECFILSQKLKSCIENKKNIKEKCVYCGKEFLVSLHDIKIKQKLNQNFCCSQSCYASYNNKHRIISPERRQEINEKIRNSLKGRTFEKTGKTRKIRTCIICNKEILIHKKVKHVVLNVKNNIEKLGMLVLAVDIDKDHLEGIMDIIKDIGVIQRMS
jgi:hypothetical protein